MDDILSQIIAYAPDRIDTETKARAMVQGPRNMYAGGQLVQPNVDGSRPGYRKPRGPKTIESFSPEIQKRIFFDQPGRAAFFQGPTVSRIPEREISFVIEKNTHEMKFQIFPFLGKDNLNTATGSAFDFGIFDDSNFTLAPLAINLH